VRSGWWDVVATMHNSPTQIIYGRGMSAHGQRPTNFGWNAMCIDRKHKWVVEALSTWMSDHLRDQLEGGGDLNRVIRSYHVSVHIIHY
jgi:hypothetical protein